MIDIPVTHFKVIHCFLHLGKGHELLRRLKQEKGLHCAVAHHARGGGLSSRKGRESFHYMEREVVTVLAPAERADEIFTFLFYAAGLDTPHAGLIVMEKAQMGVPMNLPLGIPEEG
jgi:hypothetical protein